MNRSIRIIGVPIDLGQSKRGVDLGPGALRYAGLAEKLTALGYQVESRHEFMLRAGVPMAAVQMRKRLA